MWTSQEIMRAIGIGFIGFSDLSFTAFNREETPLVLRVNKPSFPHSHAQRTAFHLFIHFPAIFYNIFTNFYFLYFLFYFSSPLAIGRTHTESAWMKMTAHEKRMAEREALRSVIQQWNANRLDLFELSEPDEVNIFIAFFSTQFYRFIFFDFYWFYVSIWFLPNRYLARTQNLQFHGVMRFYFQDRGQKVATKCIRVASDATVADVIGESKKTKLDR